MAMLKSVGPYALVELVLPGGTLLALLLWLYRHRHAAGEGRGASSRSAFLVERAGGHSCSRRLHRRPQFRQARGACDSLCARRAGERRARHLAYGGEVAGDWYRLFRSAALDQLVRKALRSSPDLDAARHGLAAAQDELKAVSGTALPQIDAAGQIGRGHINGSQLYEPVNALKATGNHYEIGPSLAYNLDPFGGVRRAIESQKAQTAAVQDQLRDTYVTLVDQVVVTAFDYAAVDAQIQVTRSLVSELQAQYNLTVQLENAGKIIHSDTLQAETQLENVRATLPGLEQQRDAYRDALARLTGETPDEFRMPALTLADFTLPAQLPVSLPSALVRAASGRACGGGEPPRGQRADRRGRGRAAAAADAFRAVCAGVQHAQRSLHPARRRLVGRPRSRGAAVPRRHLRPGPTKPNSDMRSRSRPIRVL